MIIPTYINLISMQTYILSLFHSLKDKLCAKRNNTKPTLNAFASNQRTDIMVRKTNKIPSSISQTPPNIQLQSDQSSYPNLQGELPPKEPEQSQSQNNSQVKPSLYTLKFLQNNDDQQSEAPTQAQQLIYSQLSLDEYESKLEKVIQQIHFLQQKDVQRKKQFWKHAYTNFTNQKLDQDISSIIDQDQQHNDNLLNDSDLYSQYQTHIEQIRELKYSKQLQDYPKITFEEYSEIIKLWAFGKKNSTFLIRNMKLKILEKLLARSFRTLSFGLWLNDEIINAYLQMIDKKATEIGKKYKVLNSFFGKTTFSKSKQMISRALKRNNISEQNQIIIAINNGNHWFFARIMNQTVKIYDSIPKAVCYYKEHESTSEIFNNIVQFANWFYGGNHEVEVEEMYPTQNNQSDCGMFLLCGIKDIVRDNQDWSFSQTDMPYKRIQVAKELFNQQITGFDF